ncbi:MAG: Argininosuccinate lyase [Candidatus Omnitrophica bacterium]|nr:Argininosuccinate lyase [Candidatus Omnitrophota bacterium]
MKPMSGAEKGKLWGGRFTKAPDPVFDRFSASLRWDVRLLAYDLLIDRAQTKALKACGVLNAREASRLISAIDRIDRDRRAGRLVIDPSAEDVHTLVQNELSRVCGPLADKIHTGRSRNDLVSQSSRLYCKEQAGALYGALTQLMTVIVAAAERYRNVLLPGMTHLQNAQVLHLSHILLSYVEMIDRSREQYVTAVEYADVCVLGSGALAGTTFAIDQRLIARELKLSRVTTNSYDVSGDRDHVLQLVYACALTGTHLSRIAEDLMIGQTRPYGIYDIDASLCTGSSMMPQKKNADSAELIRGASGVLQAQLAGVLSVLKGLPTSYNRDLQWDKSFLFTAVETARDVVEVMTRIFATLRVREERAARLLDDESLYATDLADLLVRKGVPFKDAHRKVGRMVLEAESLGCALSALPAAVTRQIAPEIKPGEMAALFGPERSVRLKRTAGSTHPDRVRREIDRWKQQLRRTSGRV